MSNWRGHIRDHLTSRAGRLAVGIASDVATSACMSTCVNKCMGTGSRTWLSSWVPGILSMGISYAIDRLLDPGGSSIQECPETSDDCVKRHSESETEQWTAARETLARWGIVLPAEPDVSGMSFAHAQATRQGTVDVAVRKHLARMWLRVGGSLASTVLGTYVMGRVGDVLGRGRKTGGMEGCVIRMTGGRLASEAFDFVRPALSDRLGLSESESGCRGEKEKDHERHGAEQQGMRGGVVSVHE